MGIEKILKKVGKGIAAIGTATVIYACATPQTRTVIYPVYGQGPIVDQTYKGTDFKQEIHLQPGKSYIKEKFITQTGDTVIKYYEFELGGKKCVGEKEGQALQPYQQQPQPQKKVEKKKAYEKKDTSGRID